MKKDFFKKNAGANVGENIGMRRTILPGSFQGGPRQMQQLYHDAMATVRKLRKPDLFITFTCNPTWIEIKEAILPNQSPSDRPDIISRVFRMKLNELLNDIQKKQVFGKVIGLIHVIEFQKRGLPHAHILLMLHPDDKPHTPDDYDSFACAELPNQEEEPELYRVNGIIFFHT